MKTIFKKFSIILSLALVLCLITPGFLPFMQTSTVEASIISISKKTATLTVGDTLQLKVNGTMNKVTWKSSKATVATVSSKGKVTAIKKGTAIITATIGKRKYTCKVTVTVPKLNKTEITTRIGWTEQLKVTGTKEGVVWTSTDETIATVSSTGLVTGIEIGECTIMAEVGDFVLECSVHIPQPYFMDGTNVTMYEGDTYNNVLLYSSDNTTWVSSNTNVATIDCYGNVTAIKEGTVNIMVTSGGYKYEYAITICTKPIPTTTPIPTPSPTPIETNITTTENPNINAYLFKCDTSLTAIAVLVITNNGTKPLTILSQGYIGNDGYDSLSGLVYLFDQDDLVNFRLLNSVVVASGETAYVWYRTSDLDKVGIYYDTGLLFDFTYDNKDYNGYTTPDGYFIYDSGNVGTY